MSQRTLGILGLGESIVALDACHLLEVVKPDTPLVPRPLAPAWSLGTFRLRNSLVPCVDLGGLLQLGPSGAAESVEKHIAIVNYRGGRFGLLIDRAYDMITVEQSQMSALGKEAGAASELTPWLVTHPVSGQPIYLLDIDVLFSLEGMVLAFEDVDQTSSSSTALENDAQQHGRRSHRYLLVDIEEATLAIDTAVVSEITACGAIERPVVTVEAYLGNVALRDMRIPIFDPGMLIGYPPLTSSPSHVVVLNTDSGRIGLAVTHINTIGAFDDSDLHPLPGADQAADHVIGVLSRPEQDDALCLDHRQLFTGEALGALAQIHARLGDEVSDRRNQQEWQRFAFVHFESGGRYVELLEQLDAVLPLPENLLPLKEDGPFSAAMRHREQTVSLVDLRILLGKNADAPAEHVLVADSGQGLVGFMVDQVTRIEYMDAPVNSFILRWRGDVNPDAPPIEQAKRMIAVGEGAKQQIHSVLCLQTLARLLVQTDKEISPTASA
ncbi:chemotaxis protein CheW [Halomonas sp. PR-M31]|uniref:chemotaxis protein CheW n=1 Tax=Halomonas sp. PR-M31 TaxID=1471202 RepID=UPI0006514D1A|nr:chemotaxis protein CheW [Halomonas sp. PR-M31]